MTKQTKIETDQSTTIMYFDLADLYLSDLNPRQDVVDAEIELLAESLVTCGLIQNLSGLLDENGKVGIVAGGRRLRALQIAVSDEPNLSRVPVRLAQDAHMAETWANVENSVRSELHPADEIRAFGKMYAKSLGVARIAKVFACTEKHVYRRLALSELPAPILDALKAGEINLTMANAFTIADNTERSLEVLEIVRGEATSDHRMKSLLKPNAIAGSDRRAVFVGKETYEAKGGSVGGDLFSDETTFDSPEILKSVFLEKLNAEAEKHKETKGWKWFKVIESSDVGYYEIEDQGFSRVYRVEGILTEDQSERYDELAELAQNRTLDDEGKVELAALRAILDGDYTAAQKEHSGFIAYVDQSGELSCASGLIMKSDKAAAIQAGVLKKAKHYKDDKPKSPYSQKLADDLDSIRLGARQNAVVNKSDLLLDLLAFQLAGQSGYEQVFGISLNRPSNHPSTETGFMLDNRLTDPNEEVADVWTCDFAEGFKAFQAKGKKHRNAEITRHLSSVFIGGKDNLKAAIDDVSGTSIRSVWTPTAENFFKRVNAAFLEALYIELLEVSADQAQVVAFSKMKKGEKASHLEDLFGNEQKRKAFGLDADQIARIDAWLPDYFG